MGGVVKYIKAGSELGTTIARTVASAIVGGTASLLGGGKFANGAFSGAFVHLFNFEMRASFSASGGAGFGGTTEKGLSIAYDQKSKEPWWAFWRKLSVQPYTTIAGGGYADASASLEGNFGTSANNHASCVLGTSTVIGGSIDTSLPITPSVGAEITISNDASPLYNVSAGISVGVPNPVETHVYVAHTIPGWW